MKDLLTWGSMESGYADKCSFRCRFFCFKYQYWRRLGHCKLSISSCKLLKMLGGLIELQNIVKDQCLCVGFSNPFPNE